MGSIPTVPHRQDLIGTTMPGDSEVTRKMDVLVAGIWGTQEGVAVTGLAKLWKTLDCQADNGGRMQLKVVYGKRESLEEQAAGEVRLEFTSPERQGRTQDLHQHAETEKAEGQNREEAPLRSASQGHEGPSRVGAV